jgi:hypothetical protein
MKLVFDFYIVDPIYDIKIVNIVIYTNNLLKRLDIHSLNLENISLSQIKFKISQTFQLWKKTVFYIDLTMLERAL